MQNNIVIIGGGGHAKVVAETLIAAKLNVVGFTDPKGKEAQPLLNVSASPHWIGTDDQLNDIDPAEIDLALGVGSTKPSRSRERLFAKLKKMGFRFVSVAHPSAIIASGVSLGEGAQVLAGAVIQTGCKIGDGTIVNTKASIDHESILGRFVHVAPGVTISGGVTLGDRCHIGTGAVIIQNVTIGEGAFVSAGAVVVSDISDGGRSGV